MWDKKWFQGPKLRNDSALNNELVLGKANTENIWGTPKIMIK